ncbi:predicted protein [Histoplasma capsulatum var. duboisii H88]|uniref:Predicted protein n=2 Tax=Ajellomyces capsulatus TaxID=5037 RepID=F0UCK2_AJEC8|nr:predicted protein [Histoplasma capsulatum H143]EGC43278.1 predicted protein [Histoplasma capsulatum var. duboisii H88]
MIRSGRRMSSKLVCACSPSPPSLPNRCNPNDATATGRRQQTNSKIPHQQPTRVACQMDNGMRMSISGAGSSPTMQGGTISLLSQELRIWAMDSAFTGWAVANAAVSLRACEHALSW